MRILVCHSRYRSGPASGENRVADDEVRLLREGGHQVVTFTPSPVVAGRVDLIKAGASALWNRRVVAELETLVERHRPQVVHFHNLFPALSPASLRLTSSEKPAVVMTLHNYRLLCLPGTFVRDGRICQDCLGTIPWHGVMYRCYQGSALGSATLALSLTMHRALRSFDRVDRFFAISEFVKQKYLEAGFAKERIGVKQHFAWPSQRRDGPGDYFLYLGRLSEEKGVSTLLRAWPQNGATLIVAGTGPEERRLRAMPTSGVTFLGMVGEREATRLIRHARCVLAPSVGYEGAGRVVLEAYAAGVPVIASDIGGLSEAVNDGVSGLLFPASDEAALRGAIEHLLDPHESERMGEGAFRMWSEQYRPERALKDLEDSYMSARGAGPSGENSS